MNVSQYRKKWLRQHAQYEKLAYKQLMVGFRDMANSIPFAFMTVDNYEDFLNDNLKQEQFINIYYNIYKEIGVIHGARIGRTINKQAKEFTLNAFLTEFEKNLISYLFETTVYRVTDVRRTFLEYIRKEIAVLVSNNLTMPEIATELLKRVNKRNFYRWQALRIARTETTAAANYSALQAGKVSGFVLEKVWISAVDARTRRPPKSEFNHIAMNGVKVGQDEKFKVPFNGSVQEMDFAGDPNGSAGNTINCRCANALVPKRDANGRLVRNTPKQDYDVRLKNIEKFENTIRNQSYETAGIYNRKGDLILKKDGNKDSVNFEWYETLMMKGNTVTHNHPSEVSFSKEDIHLASYNGLSEIRAVTKSRTFIMEVSKEFKGKEYTNLKRYITRNEKVSARKFYRDYKNGKYTLDEYSDLAFDDLWTTLSNDKKYGEYFNYIKIDK